jgi:hypothetical protein
MYVHIDDEGVSLRDPLDFNRFHVKILHSSGAKEADVILRRHGLGWAADEKQAYISVDALHTLNSQGDDEWHHALDRMAVGAREHGWWDAATASIAAHIAT